MSTNLIEESLMRASLAEEAARQDAMRKAWDAYYGRFATEYLKKSTSDPKAADNVAVGLARVVINKSVSFLFGQDVGFQLDGDGKKETPAEAYLAGVWRANRKKTLLQKLALNGSVTGHAFLKIVPGHPVTAPFPRLIALDPSTVTVRWDPDDIETIVRYRIQYNTLDQSGKPIVVRQTIRRAGAEGTDYDGEAAAAAQSGWLIIDEQSRVTGQGDAAAWQLVRVTPWAWPFAPIVDCQNLPAPNEYWGLPDLLKDVLDVNEAINFVYSVNKRTVRHHGHPIVWGKGFMAEKLDTAIDATLIFDDPAASLNSLEMRGDLGANSEALKRFREVFHEITQTPEVATGKLDSTGNLSGVALQILYQPLLEKTEVKRGTYGDLLVELNRRLLIMGGHDKPAAGETVTESGEGAGGLYTTLQWPEMLPGDAKAEGEALLTHKALGASSDTLLEKLGYDPEAEREKNGAAAEAAAKLLATGPSEQGGFDDDDEADFEDDED